MFPLFRRNLVLPLSCCSSLSWQVRTLREFSSFSIPRSQPHCKPFANEHIRVSVWWDLDSCGVPPDSSLPGVALSIKAAVRANGMKGKVDVNCYADTSQFEKTELIFRYSSIAFKLHHITERVSGFQRNAATTIWKWSSILKEKYLTGKIYNHFPDGPLNSWYEDSQVLLEDPVSAAEERTSSQPTEEEGGSDSVTVEEGEE